MPAAPLKSIRMNEAERALLARLTVAYHCRSESDAIRLGLAALAGLLRDGLEAAPSDPESIFVIDEIQRNYVRLKRQSDDSYSVIEPMEVPSGEYGWTTLPGSYE